jgi:hypothetical protein
MVANLKKSIAAGYERAYWGCLDTAGYVIGQDITAPAAGSDAGSGMGRIDGVKTSAITIAEPETVAITGDDGVLGQFIFPPTDTPSFIIEVGTNDLDLVSKFQGTLTMDTGDISIGVLQPNSPTFPDICLILQRRAKSRASGSTGVSAWEGVIIPKCTIVPLGSDNFTERGAVTFRYKVSVNVSTNFPWGTAVSDSANGTDGGVVFPFTAENRLHMHTFIGDGTETDFILTYTPASSALGKVRVYKDGVIQTSGVTITTATKTVAFTVAPASNAKIVVLYEHTV